MTEIEISKCAVSLSKLNLNMSFSYIWTSKEVVTEKIEKISNLTIQKSSLTNLTNNNIISDFSSDFGFNTFNNQLNSSNLNSNILNVSSEVNGSKD